MPNFEELFEANGFQSIVYGGKRVDVVDKFPVKDGETIVASIESTNSDCKQGFAIDIKGSCEIDGKLYKKGKGVHAYFWEDTCPESVTIKVFTSEGYIWVENVWEQIVDSPEKGYRSKSISSQKYGAAMYVEEIEGGRRYYCNDWHPDDDFDDIVFTIKTLKKKS